MSVIFQNTTENDTSGHHSQCLPLSLLHDLLVSGDVNAQDATFDDSQSETVEILSSQFQLPNGEILHYFLHLLIAYTNSSILFKKWKK